MNAWLMKGYFDTVPISLDESAKLDGAGHFRRFWQIVLPLVRPMIAVQALWAFMGPFGDYILSKFLLRDEINYTVAVGLQTFISDQKKSKDCLLCGRCDSDCSPNLCAVLLPSKELCFRLDSWWG